MKDSRPCSAGDEGGASRRRRRRDRERRRGAAARRDEHAAAKQAIGSGSYAGLAVRERKRRVVEIRPARARLKPRYQTERSPPSRSAARWNSEISGEYGAGRGSRLVRRFRSIVQPWPACRTRPDRVAWRRRGSRSRRWAAAPRRRSRSRRPRRYRRRAAVLHPRYPQVDA